MKSCNVRDARLRAARGLRAAFLLMLLVPLVAACGSVQGDLGTSAGLEGAAYPIEAEGEDAPGPFEFQDDGGASGGRVLALTTSDEDADAAITWPVQLDAAGEYGLWVRMRASDEDSDALHVGFDGSTTRVFPAAHGAYQWVEVERKELDPEDDPAITLTGGEPGVQIDMFAVVEDPKADAVALERHFLDRAPASGGGNEGGGNDGGGNDGGGNDGGGNDGGGSAPDGSGGSADDGSDDGGTDDDSGSDTADGGAGSGVAASGFGSLRGDPSFDRGDLSGERRKWYDRLWAAAESPDQFPDATRQAEKDDAYAYGRAVNEHDRALLYGLRATGDLRFLDAIDRLAEAMRDNLDDGWCGGVSDPYDGMSGEDGYLNFRRTYEDGEHYCRDISNLEEPLVHAHIASIAYAYQVNRDLESPGGVDYGERADFWLDYLRNHFEAKWRERNDAEWPDMHFIKTKFCHTQQQFTLYHYFVGKILEDKGDPDADAYLDEARRMTEETFEMDFDDGDAVGGFQEASTPDGPALVYPFGAPTHFDDTKAEACPTTYARYASSAMFTLHAEGFDRWADDDVMRKLARGMAHFVFDTDDPAGEDEPFAAGVTGDEEVGGITPTEYRSRFPANQFVLSFLAGYAQWDESGRIRDISLEVYGDQESDPSDPDRVFIPAAMLMVESM